MAARSPNVKLRRALDRNASRTPIKCPLSAPPKSSKPRLTRMDIISSFSKQMVDKKKRVAKPVSKSGSTPLINTKPVAAKYLTTPRSKRSIPRQSSFRMFRIQKPVNVEVGKGRVVAKALVFHSPKKAFKVKISVELRMPILKLCEGMNKLEISSQKKRVLRYSSKSPKNLGNSLLRRHLSCHKVQRKPEEPLTCTNKEAKSGKSVKNKVKGELLQQQASKKLLLGSDETDNNMNNESCEEECESASTVPPPAHDSALDDLESNNSRSRVAKKENNNSNNMNKNINLESSGESKDHLNANNSFEGEINGDEFIDNDDKESASASDGNRVNTNLKENGRRILGLHDKCGPVPKKGYSTITEQDFK